MLLFSYKVFTINLEPMADKVNYEDGREPQGVQISFSLVLNVGQAKLNHNEKERGCREPVYKDV